MAHRESVRWSITLHDGIASLQGWIAVEGVVPWMLALARSVAALNVDRADNYPATDAAAEAVPCSGILFPGLGVTGGGEQSAVIDLGGRPGGAAHLWVQLSLPPTPLPQCIPIASGWRPFDVLMATGC